MDADIWKAIGVTFLVFAIIFSGIWTLKKTANKFKVPKDVKPQPYSDGYDEEQDDY